MANEEHIRRLKKGVGDWNEWRRKHPEIRPDFHKVDLPAWDKADLNGAKLSGANLRGADLTGANLIQADLGRAILIGANLTWAKLSGANLGQANLGGGALLANARLTGAFIGGADLSGASLIHADLRAADLSNANLFAATLTGADMAMADLTGAVIDETTFGDNDLSKTKGLDAVHHVGPSTIGIDTIYRSKGEIPEIFLRGCGVPKDFVVYMRSLVALPIEFYSCFISYSRKDDHFATQMHKWLQGKGVRCWKDTEDLKTGDKFQERIESAIPLYDKLLIVLSKNSIKSAWVEREVQAGFEREQREGRTVLFPIRLDDSVMKANKPWAADLRRTRHIGDFRRWKDHASIKAAFGRLLRDLNAKDSKAA